MAVEDLGGSLYHSPVPAETLVPAVLDVSGLSAAALNADLLVSSDVSVFREALITVSGTFVGTLSFQGSSDGTTFYPISVTEKSKGSVNKTCSGAGRFTVSLDMKYLRVRMTSYTSGAATATARFSTAVSNASILPILPASVALARTVSSAGALSGSPTSVTLNSDSSFFSVIAGQYPVAFRYRALGDTNAVTISSGSYSYDEIVPAGVSMQFAVPSGTVSLSLDTMTTQPSICVIEK